MPQTPFAPSRRSLPLATLVLAAAAAVTIMAGTLSVLGDASATAGSTAAGAALACPAAPGGLQCR